MLLDEPFAGVDPIAVHDIQTIVAGLRHRGIGVLITDHNVEQTLDIVDRAYIMFEGKVQVSGPVRDLVFDDRVAELYLGPDSYGAAPCPPGGRGVKTGLSQTATLRQDLRINPRLYQAMDMLYMPMMDLQLHLKQELLINPFLELVEPEEEEAPAETANKEEEKEKVANENETDWEEILLNGFEVPGGAREEYEHKEYTEPVSVETTDLIDYLREQLQMMESDSAADPARRRISGQHQGRRVPRRLGRRDPAHGERDARQLCRAEPSRQRGGVGRDGGPGGRARGGTRSQPRPAYALFHGGGGGGNAGDRAAPRSARHRRPRPARVPAAPAPGAQGDQHPHLSPRGGGLSRPDRPPLERSGPPLRSGTRRGAGSRRPAGPARSQAGTQVLRRG